MGTTYNDSSFKVKAEVDNPSIAIPEAGALIFDQTKRIVRQGDGSEWKELLGVPYNSPYWIDLLGPLTGVNLDSAATRYSLDYYNGAIKFNSDSRYPNEIIIIRKQLIHGWKLATNADLHLHWKQQSANIPNWLAGYKVVHNGELDVIETDFSNYTFMTLQNHEFTYTSGVLNQISEFGEIDLSTAGLSDVISVIFFRDTLNASGLFAGADPSVLAEYATDLDAHVLIDAPGSIDEYQK